MPYEDGMKYKNRAVRLAKNDALNIFDFLSFLFSFKSHVPSSRIQFQASLDVRKVIFIQLQFFFVYPDFLHFRIASKSRFPARD